MATSFQASLKSLVLHQTEYTIEGVVRGDTAWQKQESP